MVNVGIQAIVYIFEKINLLSVLITWAIYFISVALHWWKPDLTICAKFHKNSWKKVLLFTKNALKPVSFVQNRSLMVRWHEQFSRPIEQCTFKNVSKYLNTSIYSYVETSGGQSSNIYLNVDHFSALVLISHLRLLRLLFSCIGV